MTTYAGINIDEATSAMICWGCGYNTSLDYNDVWITGPEYIISRAREIQQEIPDKEVWVAFYRDDADDDGFDVLVEAPIRDEPVTRFIVDERGNLRPVRD